MDPNQLGLCYPISPDDHLTHHLNAAELAAAWQGHRAAAKLATARQGHRAAAELADRSLATPSRGQCLALREAAALPSSNLAGLADTTLDTSKFTATDVADALFQPLYTVQQ